MVRKSSLRDEASFFNLSQAKWVEGVLSMLIAVVGRESLVGLILRQARFEIHGFVRDEEQAPPTPQVPQFELN